ncbi:MAG: SCP2 sterol-binding domain-containing protein [Rhodospirillales bacterium]|nr:SCP2 sterol-binding domain-containing protein [Rhodospirillales bacterium]
MTDNRHSSPPLSPVLFAGLVLRPLPPSLLQPLLGVAMNVMRERQPGLFERLDELAGNAFLIDPVDLPFCFVLKLDPRTPNLTCIRDAADAGTPTAVVRGPFLMLIDLLEGRIDGDAVFFSRDLTIEGDTEAVVTLRNAIDSGEIRVVEDLLSLLGPLSAPAQRLADAVGAVFRRATADLEAVRSAFVSPVRDKSDAQAVRIRKLEAELAEMRDDLRRLKNSARHRKQTELAET